MRIYTCTPREFGGAEDFFIRDSGLLSRGFKAIGVGSMAVMPGARKPEDLDELIRTDFKNLESPEWWMTHDLHGVILYAWGSPRYRHVAAAIRKAGIFLVLNQDNAGVISPLNGLNPWCEELWNSTGKGRGAASWRRFSGKMLRDLTIGLLRTDPLRAVHLRNGDLITCVSPAAADCYRRLCRFYGGEELVKKVRVLPHPVERHFNYDGRSKKSRIVCVGRWEDEIQKRTWMLPEVLGPLLSGNETILVSIAGSPTPQLQAWHSSLPETQRGRVDLMGFADRDRLAELMGESTVFYSPSAFESFGIAAAEALCCGCSVVAGKSVSMCSFDWFVSENSGCMAVPDTIPAHISALSSEISEWSNGKRDASAISEVWCSRLHADKVATLILAMAGPDRISYTPSE